MPGEEVDAIEVGSFFLTSEMTIKKKVVYYVVKVLDVIGDKVRAEWYAFKDEAKLFIKLQAEWNLNKEGLLRRVENPVLVGRRERILFQDVYRFILGRDYIPEK